MGGVNAMVVKLHTGDQTLVPEALVALTLQ